MARAAVLALALLAGCTAGPENKIQLRIQNKTLQPITLSAGSSIFTTDVTIQPGLTWSGWVDRRFIFSSAWVIVEKGKQ